LYHGRPAEVFVASLTTDSTLQSPAAESGENAVHRCVLVPIRAPT
jgi:hypothetical protein